MGGLCDKLQCDDCLLRLTCGRDLDDYFAYRTPLVARIRDRRLGLLRLGLSVLIFLYIVFYQIIYMRGWAETGQITGTNRFSVQQPTVNSCDPDAPSCLPVIPDRSKFAYCQRSNLSYVGHKLPCFVGDQGIQDDKGVESEHYIKTRSRQVQQLYNSTAQRYYNRGRPLDDAYTTDVESFTVLLLHSFFVTFGDGSLPTSGTSSSLHGWLHSRNSALCDRFPDAPEEDEYRPGTKRPYSNGECLINPNRTKKCLDNIEPEECGIDIFKLGDLLDAAPSEHPRLDDVVRHSSSDPETYREGGMIVRLVISYDNRDGVFGFLREKPVYRITVDVQPKQTAKWVWSFNYFDTAAGRNDYARYLYTSHGLIFFVEHRNKSVYTFSFPALLMNITTSLTLIAIASTMVDTLMLSRICGYRHYYRNIKYQNTVDFSDLDSAIKQLQSRGVRLDSKAIDLMRLDFRADEDQIAEDLAKLSNLSGSTIKHPSNLSGGVSEKVVINPAAVDGENDGIAMIDLFRWEPTRDGKKRFVKVQVPRSVLEQHARA